MLHRLAVGIAILAAALGISACRSVSMSEVPSSASQAPYPHSRLISSVGWSFSPVKSRKAHGSDIWVCTWARDGNEYCAWGDGGGFDGNDDHVGRVSLGFARLTGTPRGDGSSGFNAKDVWGAPPYAEHPANFGGKVASLVSIDGVLYATGALWTSENTPDPVQKSGEGPTNTLTWSNDLGKNWHIASWSTQAPAGTFLNFGRDNRDAIDSYVYLYYLREADDQNVYLKRVAKGRLTSDPSIPGSYQYFAGFDAPGLAPSWSIRESDARPVFFDPNHVSYPDVAYEGKLHRYLMTVGHYRSGHPDDSSIGQWGLFEAAHPWGPWATIAYYDDWGNYGRAAAGDFLGVHMPLKWVGFRGKTFWFVFSGPGELDSFNLAKAKMRMGP